jgi:hypothetical protein
LRRIPLSRRSHIVGFQPLPTGLAEHESALERDFVTLVSFLDPGVSITSQPITLAFRDGQRLRRYTPDFLVRPSNGRAQLVEVKYRGDLRQQWTRLKPAFKAARIWAEEQGTEFRIATERSIRGTRLENAKRLLPLRDAPIDVALAERALYASRSLDAPTFGAVLAALPVNQQTALTTLWRLIARGRLRVDLSRTVTFDTPITPA